MSSLTNANSRSNPDIALSLSATNDKANTKTLDLEPNPFEQSFARSDDVIPQSEVQFCAALRNKNLVGLAEKPLVKPQSDTQLNNLRHQNQQAIIENLSQHQNYIHKSDPLLSNHNHNNNNNNIEQVGSFKQLQQAGQPPQIQIQISDSANVDPSQINNQIQSKNQNPTQNNPNIQQQIPLPAAQDKIFAKPSNSQNLNVQQSISSPPVLTPGGSKRVTSSVLPPLPGIVSPGGGSFIATPGIWNALFPQTPGIAAQNMQNSNSHTSNNNNSNTTTMNVNTQIPMNISNLGQLSPNTLNAAQQQLQQVQMQNNKNYEVLQKQIQQFQAHQQEEQSRQQIQDNEIRKQVEQQAEKQLQQAQMQLQQAQLQAQIKAQVLSQVQQLNQSSNTSASSSLLSIPDQNNKMNINVQTQQPKDQQLYNFLVNAKRSGLTPNESSLRTGLTPGSTMTANNPLYSYLSMTPGAITPLTSMLNSLNNSNNTTVATHDSNIKQDTKNELNKNIPNVNEQPKVFHSGLTDLTVPTMRTIDLNPSAMMNANNILQDNTKNESNANNTNNENMSMVDMNNNIMNPLPKITQQQIQNSSVMIHNHKDSVDSSIISNSAANTPGLVMKPISNQVFYDENMKNANVNGVANNQINGNHDVVANGSKKRNSNDTNGLKKVKKQKRSHNDEMENDSVSPSSSSPPPAATKASKPSTGKRRKNLTEEEKRQNFLERNRVAASKCRQRKKEMVSNMKEELESFKNENKSLREQVGMLREHALTLRTILYAHKDCSFLIEQVGGIQNLNTVLNATNYVSSISQAHEEPESIKPEHVSHLLNNSSTNVQVAVAAAVAHTTNRAIERQEENRLPH